MTAFYISQIYLTVNENSLKYIAKLYKVIHQLFIYKKVLGILHKLTSVQEKEVRHWAANAHGAAFSYVPDKLKNIGKL